MADPRTPLRLLVVMPSWVGDSVMATPVLGMIRRAFPGAFVGGLVRPGIDQLLAGTEFFDEIHVERAQGVMGPKFVAAKLRPRRYDTCLLLPNSFSTALIVRIAGIPRRIGYDRDARGLLLTDKIPALKDREGKWQIVSAVDYYYTLAAKALLPKEALPRASDASASGYLNLPPGVFMSLVTTPEEEAAATEILARASLCDQPRLAILNPGGNNEAKRWPADRFAAIARHLVDEHRCAVLVNGSPSEAALTRSIAEQSLRVGKVASLPDLGISLASLKALVKRSCLLVTNDTGPRHIAAALGVPLVSLFGPTDHRWTTIPTRPGGPEAILLADPTLPSAEIANDHPARCRIDRIEVETAIQAVDRVLARPRQQIEPTGTGAGVRS